MKLSVSKKMHYGLPLYLPLDNDGILICKLSRRKYFSQWHIDLMQKDGWNIEVKNE